MEFQNITAYDRKTLTVMNQVLDRINGEIAHARAGEPAYIGFKINSLTDKTIIDRLIEAYRVIL